jgi:hypothetical protein
MHPDWSSVRFGPFPRATALGILAIAAAILTAQGQTGFDPSLPRTADRGFSETGPRIIDRLPVFFPPNPPPLGRPAARGIPPGGRYPAPPELAAYVSEFFYPALGTRLVMKNLSAKQQGHLDAYRAAKLTLQNELRTELDRLRPVEPAARLEGLTALSRRQTPKIVELEKTAEQLRRDLVTGDNNWSALRQWHLSDKQRRGYSPIEIAQVMRAYAFYENNLLPSQRRLLREISIEMVFAAENTAAATAAQPYMFFPPEPARVLFPDDLPAEVAMKVASYQTKKSALKKELYDTVYSADGATFGFLRGSPSKALAARQAGRLAELESLAEEIRRGLSTMPPPRAERSPLPQDLEARLNEMIATYHRTQAETAAKIDGIIVRAKDLPLQANYRFEGETLKFLVVPTRGARGGSTRGGGPGGNPMPKIEAVRAEIAAVADEYGRRIADMFNVRESIRQGIGESLQLTKPEDIDRVLLAAMRIVNQRQAENSFSEYRTAVFEPGLSPEQRRLLFDGVVERLELPLPRGDLQASMRAETW